LVWIIALVVLIGVARRDERPKTSKLATDTIVKKE